MDTVTAQLQNEPPSNDIFSLSDQVLSDRLEFIEEIGFGNWGSVWLCRPKPATTSEGVVRPLGQKIAVKLVHRSKTSTTAARVRSLWNEMKIVKSFKSDPHPAIIPFHSFIITPSYALITMSYLPTLVPVEVEETKAREWFRFLLSGVKFLHERGVVHNDIKPANILLSHKNIPVLVDFGFAEKYDMESDTAFHSNLSYGTPEYLSPERARGLPHDTRKSDVWSLGVTFFEILIGRTPFEHSDGEQFNSNEDLEKYWARTLRGKWVGTWQFSKGMEKLLQRMISPNADLRCTAMQAMADSYWQAPKKDAVSNMHKRASSYTSAPSVGFENDMEKLLSMTPSSWRAAAKAGKENANGNLQSPPGLDRSDIFKDSPENVKPRPLAKSKSQPRVAASSKIAQPRKRVPVPPMADLSPIKASPNPSPMPSPAYHPPPGHGHVRSGADASMTNASMVSASAKAKENISSFNRLAASVAGDPKKEKSGKTDTGNGRKPFGALNANNLPAAQHHKLAKKPSGHSHGAKAVKVLGELSNNGTTANANTRSTTANAGNVSFAPSVGDKSTSSSVKDRVKEWEREKERLREMERLEEIERERDEIYEKEKERRKRKARKAEKQKAEEEDRQEQPEEEEKDVPVEESEDIVRELKAEKDVEEEEEYEHIKEEKGNASHLQIRIPGVMSPASRRRQSLGLPPRIHGVNTQRKTSTKQSDKWDWDKENVGSSAVSPVLPMFRTGPPLTQVFNISMDTPPPPSAAATRLPRATGKGSFKHSIKASIDKTIEFCKATSLAQVASGRSTPARGFSFDVMRPSSSANNGNHPTSATVNSSTKDGREAWELEVQAGDGSLPEISPLPVIKNAAESERVAADSRMDRMTIWMRNVEKVVEDAKQNFASSTTTKELPLPPLPPPLSRTASQNKSRLPRRVLAASQIFQSDENGNISPMMDTSLASNNNSVFLSANDISKVSFGPKTPARARPPSLRMSSCPTGEGQSQLQIPIPEIHTPSRQRRATVSTRSPEPATAPAEIHTFAAVEDSPSKRKEKSKSHGNLFQMHIAPISLLEAELLKTPPPEPTPRLSQVLDRNLFIAQPLGSRDDLLDTQSIEVRDLSLDDLNASPCHVEPYPQRVRSSHDAPIPDTPSRHRIEGVYDRFLMATSGVKRLGKGYQSDNVGPISSQSTSHLGLGVSQHKEKTRAFYSTRRPMPPPVSSDDQRRAASVDELGAVSYAPAEKASDSPGATIENGGAAVGLMRKAMKLMAPKSTTSRRLSRIG